MPGSAGPEDRFPPASTENAVSDANPDANPEVNPTSTTGAVRDQFRTRDQANGSHALAETELDSALQLLVDRAQYITGATGTALALPQGEEMVCRASAGSCAPAVGARLQVRSGLTGESISRRQLLRCDNAEIDPRVNLEACRALGIASIIVMPLLRHKGEVCGLFELFSDHPYAFEERDLVALERMADLTLTALDLAERRENSASGRESNKPGEFPTTNSALPIPAIPVDISPQPLVSSPEPAEPAVPAAESEANPQPVDASIPEGMLRVHKCASCGFPVSEGRELCLDCEKNDREKQERAKKDLEKKREQEQDQSAQGQNAQGQSDPQEIQPPELDTSAGAAPDSAVPRPEESVPAFLTNYAPAQESWMANHVNLLAIAVLILVILVGVVVFR